MFGFPFLSLTKTYYKDIFVHVFLCTWVGVAGYCGMSIFNLKVHCQVLLQNGGTECCAVVTPTRYLIVVIASTVSIARFKNPANMMDMNGVSHCFHLHFSNCEVGFI